MSTFFAKPKDYSGQKKWHLIDAKGEILGRLASRISRILTGKIRPDYTAHVETGDGVIVINAKEIRVTGTKIKTKLYKNFSGYPGGLRERTFERVMSEDPTYILKHAVKGMLPKSRLGRRMATHLLVYPDATHPHQAQLNAGQSKRTSTKPAAKGEK